MPSSTVGHDFLVAISQGIHHYGNLVISFVVPLLRLELSSLYYIVKYGVIHNLFTACSNKKAHTYLNKAAGLFKVCVTFLLPPGMKETSTYKKTNIFYSLIRTCTCAYQVVKSFGISEICAFTKWMITVLAECGDLIANVRKFQYSVKLPENTEQKKSGQY